MRLLALSCIAALGCNNPIFLREPRVLETTPHPDPTIQGYVADSALFILPVRRPSVEEIQLLTTEAQARMLTAPIPWAAARDFEIEIEYTIQNLEAQTVQALFFLNGGNEFGDYLPALYRSPDLQSPDPPPLLGNTPIVLESHATHSGIFREDEIREASIDLEAIVRFPLNDPFVTPFVVIAHLSSVSPDGLDNIPASDVTPEMARFRFTLESEGHVKADYVVRVRDHGGKLDRGDLSQLYIPTAAEIAPTPITTMGATAGVMP